jgi:hypothetical protein
MKYVNTLNAAKKINSCVRYFNPSAQTATFRTSHANSLPSLFPAFLFTVTKEYLHWCPDVTCSTYNFNKIVSITILLTDGSSALYNTRWQSNQCSYCSAFMRSLLMLSEMYRVSVWLIKHYLLYVQSMHASH